MAMVAGQASAGGLVANGGFEWQEDDGLAVWSPSQTSARRIPNTTAGCATGVLGVRYTWDTASRGDGKGSLRLETPEAYDRVYGLVGSPVDETRIVLAPEAEYRLVFWYRAQGLAPWDEQRRDCVLLVDVFFQQGEPPPRGSGRRLSNKRVYIKDDAAEWKKVETVFRTPAGTDWGQLRLQLASVIPNRKATVWFDDISLEPVTPGAESAAPAARPTNWTARSAVREASATQDDTSLVPPAVPYGERIQRTMKLLATSTPERRNRVKILFYGQSIIGQSWWKTIVYLLHARYPNADIVAENPSIGGFEAEELKDTMYADVYPANADLILFHDYGSVIDLEEMFVKMRGMTTAEVMPFTHHVSWIGNAGHQRADNEQSARILEWSRRFGFEAVDIRANWTNRLAQTGSQGEEFLKDIVHLSPAGEELWTTFSMPHFQYRPEAKPYWTDWIRVYTGDGKPFAPDAQHEYPDGSVTMTGPLKLSFEGSRVDVLADPIPGVKLGTAKILIDGQAPSTMPELYYATRGSRAPNHFQPMLRRVQVGGNPVVENWTLTFSDISTNGEDFVYEVKGSVTGPDGKGNAKEKFVSDSGRIVIEPEWFYLRTLLRGGEGVPYPDGTACTFATRANFMDVWAPERPVESAADGSGMTNFWNGSGAVIAVPKRPGSEDRYTLASGLVNGPHTLEIIPNGDGALPLRAIVVHRPPTKADR